MSYKVYDIPSNDLDFVLTYRLPDELKQSTLELKNKLMETHVNDMEFYSEIKDHFKKNNYYFDNASGDNRGNSRIKTLQKLRVLKGVRSYLDIGSYDGILANAVTNELKLDGSNSFGIDVQDYPCKKLYTFKKYDGINIPFRSQTFDLITCFMVLHHVPYANAPLLIRDIYRVLNKKGLFVIREHDANLKLRPVLDILHDYYDYSLNKETMVWENRVNYYRTAKEWDKIITSCGLIRIHPYSLKPPQKWNKFANYYAVYKK